MSQLREPSIAPIIPLRRLGYLDALRGFAALYVVIFHISVIPKPSLEVPSWLYEFISYGGSGVTLFFVISGFSMAMTWRRHASSGMPFKSFYIARFFRIAPLFYLWLILTLLRDFVFKAEEGIHSTSEVLSNAFFIFNFYEPFQQGITWASWTIGVEMLFYLLFPIIARCVKKRLEIFYLLLLLTSVVLVITLQGGRATFTSAMVGSMGFFHHFPVFIFGILAFHYQQKINLISQSSLRNKLKYFLALSSFVGISAVIFLQLNDLLWQYALAAFYSTLLLVFSMVERNPLVNSASSYVGKISYSLYLNHPNVVYLLTPFYLMLYRMGFGVTVSFLSCVAMTLLILIPMSHITYRFIEEPLMYAGKRFLMATVNKNPCK